MESEKKAPISISVKKAGDSFVASLNGEEMTVTAWSDIEALLNEDEAVQKRCHEKMKAEMQQKIANDDAPKVAEALWRAKVDSMCRAVADELSR